MTKPKKADRKPRLQQLQAVERSELNRRDGELPQVAKLVTQLVTTEA